MQKYPYGYCGMPCALCSRYHTQGSSKCAGCSGGGYYTYACKAHSCCVQNKIEHCGLCAGYPCKKLGNMSDFRDLDTRNAKARACADIAARGFEAYKTEYARRADLLARALSEYNDGRMKRYMCELFIQSDIDALERIMKRAEGISGAPKERGRAFREIAQAMRAHDKAYDN